MTKKESDNIEGKHHQAKFDLFSSEMNIPKVFLKRGKRGEKQRH